jgi:hypothetical protein
MPRLSSLSIYQTFTMKNIAYISSLILILFVQQVIGQTTQQSLELTASLYVSATNGMVLGASPSSGGNGVGYIGGNSAGLIMQAPGYGSAMPAPGGDILLSGGVSEDYEGGDIIIDTGNGAGGNGYIFLDAENKARVGVGYWNYNSVQFKLDVNGSVRATSYITLSDRNLKTDIATLDQGLSKVLSLRGVRYKFKENIDMQLPKGNQVGFIAQEVESILPDAVVTDANGLKGVDYTKVIPVLVEAMKEQQDALETLKTRLTSLQEATSAATGNATQEAALFQNVPNPFTEATEIPFSLSDNVRAAYIVIYDFQGTQLKKYSLNKSNKSLKIEANTLKPGLYYYALLVDGKEVDVKRLMLTK